MILKIVVWISFEFIKVYTQSSFYFSGLAFTVYIAWLLQDDLMLLWIKVP